MEEMAEVSRIHYEIEYTEGISQRMRIPDKLHVAPSASGDHEGACLEAPHHVLMQVPERIVVAEDSEASQYPRSRDLDFIQATPLESLALKTPPRVLTLSDQPLDFLELERPVRPAQPSEEVHSQVRVRRERSVSENTAVRQNGQLTRNDSIKPVLRGGSSNPPHDPRFGLSALDTTLDGAPDDMAAVDATTLRRQIIKLNRRLQLLEEENKERTKREMIMYSITVAFWIINSWIWFRR
ncbi:mitochondrial fission factor homolog B isoform X1 [Megalops cyprinoides]|uniref:mitochondrial fission factor homolog B isoform X1 n=1 Tax=Megalops cyprinoides TaxID=118141 RepID=UPI0018641759|nr:mitochondrial fission factor homolog B isoform X1 [Megalops cyprinoides]